MNASPPDWHQSRPYRNLNPGDLRTLEAPQHWVGQTGTDDLAGGPFAKFGREQDGWRALATCLRTYQDVHGLRTIHGMIERFAPAMENDTAGYVRLMCSGLTAALGKPIGPDTTIDAHQPAVMDVLCRYISVAEGSARIVWSTDARAAGIKAALA